MAIMTKIKRFIVTLGQTADPFRKFDPEYYLPKEWRGKSTEQRASKMIADSFTEGVRLVSQKRPELYHVQETSQFPAFCSK